jgi:hypothetical protein
MGISMRLLAVVALMVAAAVAGAAAEEQVAVDLAGAGEIAAGVKEAAEAAALRAELAQLREKISALGQLFTPRLAICLGLKSEGVRVIYYSRALLCTSTLYGGVRRGLGCGRGRG